MVGPAAAAGNVPGRQRLDPTRHDDVADCGMTNGRTVIATWIFGVLEQFAALGIRVEERQENQWLRDVARLTPTRQLQLVVVRRLWQHAARQSREPLLGLRVGEALPLQAMNVVAILAMHSPTMRAALSSTVRYQALVSNSGRFDIRPVAGGLRLYYQVTPCPVPMHPAQIDSVFAGYWSLLRRCSPPGTRPARMGLPGVDPEQRSAYETFFGCPVELGVELGYAEFDDATLDHVLRAADPDLLRLATDRADAMRAAQDHSDALVDHVQATVTALGFAGVQCAQVARELGMSTRSLQRRLAEYGTTFRKLAEAARMDEALRLLADDALPVARISNRLGFSEPSAFSHAVHDYWGAPPRVLRREFAQRTRSLT